MACYTLELVHECHECHECHERDDVGPMLPSVPCAYILTMHETETFPWLHGVARRTYVQRNRGFRACAKTQGIAHGPRVDATNQDIIHAYRTVFASALIQSASAPVLVFEDDARLTRTARQDLVHVDRFVATRAFSLYTLGSIGLMVPYYGDRGGRGGRGGRGDRDAFRHWRFVGSAFGFAQSVIYAPSAARAVLDAAPGPLGHIDATVLSTMPLRLTYHRPIAYQVIDFNSKSENSATWCVRCDGGVLDSVVRKLAWLYFGAVGLDTEAGWGVMYTLNKLAVPVGLLCACVVVVGVVVAVRGNATRFHEAGGPVLRPRAKKIIPSL
jgi:hypothetical protein